MHFTSNAQKTIPVTKNSIPGGDFGTIRTVVKLDPLTRLPIGNVPFDRTFILRVYFDSSAGEDNKIVDVKGFYLMYKSGKTIALDYYFIPSAKINDYDQSDIFLKMYPNAIDVVVPPLEPNKNYSIYYSTSTLRYLLPYFDAFNFFYNGQDKKGINLVQDFKKANNNDRAILTGATLKEYYDDNKKDIDSIFDSTKNDLTKRNNQLLEYINVHKSLSKIINGQNIKIDNLFGNIKELAKIGTQQYYLKTNATYRIVADGGVIYTGWQQGFNTATPYVGMNISFRPMDVDIPFRTLIRNKRIKFYQRFTFNLGLTLNSIAKDNYRTNLISNNNVMIGLGYKLSHAINLNFGGLLYNNIDPNPLIVEKTLGIAPYTGISINLLIKDALGDIAKIFSYGK